MKKLITMRFIILFFLGDGGVALWASDQPITLDENVVTRSFRLNLNDKHDVGVAYQIPQKMAQLQESRVTKFLNNYLGESEASSPRESVHDTLETILQHFQKESVWKQTSTLLQYLESQASLVSLDNLAAWKEKQLEAALLLLHFGSPAADIYLERVKVNSTEEGILRNSLRAVIGKSLHHLMTKRNGLKTIKAYQELFVGTCYTLASPEAVQAQYEDLLKNPLSPSSLRRIPRVELPDHELPATPKEADDPKRRSTHLLSPERNNRQTHEKTMYEKDLTTTKAKKKSPRKLEETTFHINADTGNLTVSAIVPEKKDLEGKSDLEKKTTPKYKVHKERKKGESGHGKLRTSRASLNRESPSNTEKIEKDD